MNPQNPQSGPFFTPEKKPDNQEHIKHGIKNTLSIVAILVSAPLAALIITVYIFQSYVVFGPSMETTLFNGDRLIVLKAPRTWAKIRNKTFMPRRGEIIVFNRPNAVRFSGDERQLIKRVIALPGERVVVKDGILTVYNTDNPGGFQPDTNPEYSEAIKTTAIETDVTVPEGQVFVCGDNRGNSLDSRSFGPINTSDIVGIATTRFLPLSTMKNL